MSDTGICKQCNGTGELDRYPGNRPMPCSFCSGSGLAKEPKFRVTCECGVVQPGATLAWNAERWMKDHLKTHRPKETFDA